MRHLQPSARHALLVLLIPLVACTEDRVELLVDLRTDMIPGREYVSVESELRRALDGSPQEEQLAVMQGDGGSFRIAEYAGLIPGHYELVVTLVRVDGTAAVERLVELDLDESFAVTVLITRDCVGVSCGDPEAPTCLAGTCVPPGCTPETPEECTVHECSESVACPESEAAPCADPTCVSEVCFYDRRDTQCEEGEYCASSGFCAPEACTVNGILEGMEQCDDNNDVDTDRCRNSCTLAVCGDGVVRTYVEECDDGNLVNGDGCSSQCLRSQIGSDGVMADGLIIGPDGHRYTRHETAASFESAEAACWLQGGHLAIILPSEEVQPVLVDQLLGASSAGPWWIGLGATTLGWEWLDGSPVLMGNWAMAPPPAPNNSLAVTMAADGKWNALDHRAVHAYLCETEGWVVKDDDTHAYRMHFEARSWDLAQSVCLMEGAHLATIGSADENTFVSRLVDFDFWLGFSDRDSSGTYEWVTGEAVEFENWFGAPNAGYCLRNKSADTWGSSICSHALPFVCESE